MIEYNKTSADYSADDSEIMIIILKGIFGR